MLLGRRDVEKSGIGDISQLIHWHTLGVGALAWAPGGGSLLSGGAERVLVRHWLARNSPDSRETLARLPAAVTRIALDA